jgi:hypothetical protein
MSDRAFAIGILLAGAALLIYDGIMLPPLYEGWAGLHLFLGGVFAAMAVKLTFFPPPPPCDHEWREWYADLRADEPGGPKTFHEIHWTCKRCGVTR